MSFFLFVCLFVRLSVVKVSPLTKGLVMKYKGGGGGGGGL